MKQRYPSAPLHAYVGGTELGVIDLLRTQGVYVNAITAKEDKYARALSCAAAWNRGEVCTPEAAPWLSAFIGEVADFSGISDDHDDQVDALVAGFDALGIGGAVITLPQPGPKAAAWHLDATKRTAAAPRRGGWNQGSG